MRSLFLIDGLGAFVTAFFLFVILRTNTIYCGMPEKILVFLSLIAFSFSIYSFACFFLLKENLRSFLKIMMMANLLYCCLTAGLVVHHYQRLTALGMAYFLTEIVIMLGLVYVEYKLSRAEV